MTAILSEMARVKQTTPRQYIKKTHRFRPGTAAIREIRRYQKTGDLLICKAPFERLVREVLAECGMTQIQPDAINALQEAAEAYLVGLFEDSQLSSIHRKAICITADDMRLARRLRQ